MAGKPRGNEPRTETVRTRLTATGKARFDQLRGERSESDYLRELIAADSKRHPA